jgi:hypothetical protein
MGGWSLHHLADHLRRDGRLRECVMVDQPMTATHTPTPWRVNGYYSRPLPDKPKGSQIVSDRGDGFEFHIAAVGTHPGINTEQARANAAFIVEAVNSHEALKARIQELEANEKAYEEIIGKKAFQEVADRIRELEAVLQDIGEFCSGDQSTLGSVVRLGRIQSIASAALQPKATP